MSKVRLPIDKREVTAILVRLGGPAGIGMQKQVNKSAFAIAVSPISVLNQLLEFFVKPVKFGLFILTSLVCIVSAIGILVSIYNSMSERKRDIAVMRALGASRDHVTAIILLESTMIAVIGGVAGWLIGHLAGPISNVWTKSTTGNDRYLEHGIVPRTMVGAGNDFDWNSRRIDSCDCRLSN